MNIRALSALFVCAALVALAPRSAEAQVSGRVILEEGPIGVDIVFGSRPSVVVEYGERRYEPRRHPYRVIEGRRPVRYRSGMTLFELERYMAWVDAEYRYFRQMRPWEAYDRFGWTERDLDRYVDWLKDERKFLEREHKHLRKAYRGNRGNRGNHGRGRGRGRGPGW